jgi:hypothetical protein
MKETGRQWAVATQERDATALSASALNATSKAAK